MIFDAAYFVEQLPHSIEAVFFMKNNDCVDSFYDGHKCEDYARKAHKRMLKYFHLTDAQLPLLELDLFNWKQPFRDVNPHPTPPP